MQSLTQAGLVERPEILRASFNDVTAVIKAAQQAVAAGCRGVALARGGGAGLELIANSPQVTQAMIDLGVPFYSAMGHGDDIFLMDKYADQNFHTPSELGSALARAVSTAAENEQKLLQISYGSRRTIELSGALSEVRASEAAVRAGEAAAKARAAEAQKLVDAMSAALTKKVHAHAHGVSLSWPMLGVVGIAGALFLAAVVKFL